MKGGYTHHFDVQVASEVGVIAAVIYSNIQHWTAKNRANNRHFHEGVFWTYNSIKAFEELFPYLTVSQIRTALQKLIDAQFIRKGNFNEVGYDRTLWYCDIRQIHLSEIANGIAENDKPIPDIKPDNKPNTPYSPPFEKFWKTFADSRGKAGAYRVWKRKKLDTRADEIITGAKRYVKTRGDDGRYWKQAQGWLNDERWADGETTQPIKTNYDHEMQFIPEYPA